MSGAERARTRYDDAVRAERLALIEATPALRARARRRRAGVRLFAVAALLVTIGLLVAAGVQSKERSSVRDRLGADAAARTAAAAAVVTMLTPDPARAAEYVPDLLAVTTGTQRDRVERVAVQLTAFAAGLERPASASVVSTGLTSRRGDSARLVMVVAASDPQLVGGAAGGGRLTLDVELRRVDGHWLVERAEALGAEAGG